MTTLPPNPPPPYSAPNSDNRIAPRSRGTVALVFGIILCAIAFFPTVRGSSLLLLSIVRLDSYTFGLAIGTLIGAALFAIPGIFLIRRCVRIRRENRAIAAEAIYGTPADQFVAPNSAVPSPAYGPASVTPNAEDTPPASKTPPPVPPV